MTTRDLLATWDRGLLVPFLCLLALAAYAVHSRRRLQARVAFFGLSVAVFFVALASPIGVLARGYLFSAHMLQHLLLTLAVPPLAFLGLPRERDGVAREWGAARCLRSWLAGVGAMWIWHAPTLCNAAATNPSVQWLQIGSLLAMGLTFWRPVLAPRLTDRLPVFSALIYLFTACVACTLLGVMVTLSPVEVCQRYRHPVDALSVMPLIRNGWGLSHQADQELGGLMMWVPPCLVYAAAILATIGRYYAEERQEHSLPRAVGGAE